MNIKQDNTDKFCKAQKFDVRLKRKVEKLIIEYDNQISNREAIQRIKENYREAWSGGRLGQVFIGNSNKYYRCNIHWKIQNRLYQRNCLKKDYSLYK